MARPKTVASRPTVVEAREEAVYDEWVIANRNLDGTGVGVDFIRGVINFRKARTLEDGSRELAPPSAEATAQLPVGDVRGYFDKYPQLREAIEAIDTVWYEIAADLKIL